MPMLLVLTLILGSMLVFFLAVYMKLNSLKPVVEVKQVKSVASVIKDVYDSELISVENGIDILKHEFLRLGFDSERTTDWRHLVKQVLPINTFIDTLLQSGYSNPKILAFNSSKESIKSQVVVFTLDKVIKSDTGKNTTHKVGFICPIHKLETKELKGTFEKEEIWVCTTNLLVIIPGSRQIEQTPEYIRDHIKYSEIDAAIDANYVEFTHSIEFNPTVKVLTWSPSGGNFRYRFQSVNETRFSIDELKPNYSTVEINYGEQVKFTDDLTKLIALIRASVMEGKSVLLTDSDNIKSGGTGKTSLMNNLAKQFALDPNNDVNFIKGVPSEAVSSLPEIIEQSIHRIREIRFKQQDIIITPIRDNKNVIFFIDQAENILNPINMPTIIAALENYTDVNISFIMSFNYSPIVAIPKPMLRQGRSITFKFGYLENPSVLDLITKLSKLDIVTEGKYFIDGGLAEKYINGEVKCTLNDVYALLKSNDMSVLDSTIKEL
jgi:hypothetical protein